jgi:hypothetical protein
VICPLCRDSPNCVLCTHCKKGYTVFSSFICKSCGNGEHKECRGGTWCDCLHRVKKAASV